MGYFNDCFKLNQAPTNAVEAILNSNQGAESPTLIVPAGSYLGLEVINYGSRVFQSTIWQLDHRGGWVNPDHMRIDPGQTTHSTIRSLEGGSYRVTLKCGEYFSYEGGEPCLGKATLQVLPFFGGKKRFQ